MNTDLTNQIVSTTEQANISKVDNESSYLLISITGYRIDSSLRVDLSINLDGEKHYIANDIYRNPPSNLNLKNLVEINRGKLSISLVKDIAKDLLKEIGYINAFYSTVEVKQLSKNVFNTMVKDGVSGLVLHYRKKPD